MKKLILALVLGLIGALAATPASAAPTEPRGDAWVKVRLTGGADTLLVRPDSNNYTCGYACTWELRKGAPYSSLRMDKTPEVMVLPGRCVVVSAWGVNTRRTPINKTGVRKWMDVKRHFGVNNRYKVLGKKACADYIEGA